MRDSSRSSRCSQAMRLISALGDTGLIITRWVPAAIARSSIEVVAVAATTMTGTKHSGSMTRVRRVRRNCRPLAAPITHSVRIRFGGSASRVCSALSGESNTRMRLTFIAASTERRMPCMVRESSTMATSRS